jgi:hypothetical protein
MADQRKFVGTDELVGATVTKVFWDEVRLEKDGRQFVLEKVEEWGSCFCDEGCSCYPTTHLEAYEMIT